MKKILESLVAHQPLTYPDAKELMVGLGSNMFNEHEMTALLTVFLMRSITIEELKGFRDALLELCLRPNFEERTILDIVGTGGDGKNTFNISTLSCFIVAGAGQMVAKHGNYGATSVSGASNVMELIGYKFKNDSNVLKEELDKAGFCFIHAPLFHPALKTVATIRKNLGIRTIFNILGPLVNPALPQFQLIGVYNHELARIYNYMLQPTGKQFAVIHGLDGYDEISLTNDTKLITNQGEFILSPYQLGKRHVSPEDLEAGNTAEEAATLFMKIIKGEGSWAQNAVVLANAAMALHITGKYPDYPAAYQAAVESLDGGKALACLNRLLALQ